MILQDDKHVTIEFYPDINCISFKWKGFTPSQYLRECVNSVINFVEDKQATAVINDLVEMKGISREDQEWLATNAAPRMIGGGARILATILPTSAFATIASREIVNQASEEFKTLHQNFDKLEEALQWVGQKQVQLVDFQQFDKQKKEEEIEEVKKKRKFLGIKNPFF